MQTRSLAPVAALAVLAIAVAGNHAVSTAATTSCAPPAVPDPMPIGAGHDHDDVAQHDFACGVDAIAWDGLTDLVPEPMLFGELDLAGDLLVMATAYKEAGFVTIDVSDPADPIALARYQGPRCEEVAIDVDCGADVKLKPDGSLAFLGIQYVSYAPTPYEDPEEALAAPVPGVHVVDLSDPSVPRLASVLPLPPSGVHMLAYHEIDGDGYVFAAHNLVGVTIARLDEVAGVPTLVPVHVIEQTAHDVSLFDDPTDGRTYLSLSGERAGLVTYDVTDVEEPVRLGTWQDDRIDYYIHTAETFRWGERRYTMVVPEVFSGTERAEPGPVWVLDTTDPTAPVLAGTWTNPGTVPGGAIGFSPHNFWQHDGVMVLAHYHGGVWVLDWRSVLDGEASRPAEIGYYVPDEIHRPYPEIRSRRPFLRGFELLRRPSVWDVATDGTHIYVSDITGGFSVLGWTDAPA